MEGQQLPPHGSVGKAELGGPLTTGGRGVDATQRGPHEPDVALHFEVLIAEGLGEA
jgi:hypothetical protein